MTHARLPFYRAVAAASLAVVIASCAATGGFGNTPPTYPQQPGGVNPNQVRTSPAPTGSTSPLPSPTGSASPGSPTPAPKPTIEVQGASARFGYDGSADDPAKAGKLVELSFAVKNTTTTKAAFAGLTLRAGDTEAASLPTPIVAPPNGIAQSFAVALKPKLELAPVRQMTVGLTDETGKVTASATIDGAPADTTSAPLDEKHPSGGVTIEAVEVSRIEAPGAGFHYVVTFALTNASNLKIEVASLLVSPPKGSPAKMHLPLTLPPRTTTSFVSIIVPYAGKTLPKGEYTITAMAGANAVAKGSGPLL